MPATSERAERFLARPLDDIHALKMLAPEAVDAELAALNPYFVTPPYLHQKVCFLAGVKHPRLVLLLWMGTGKTKIVLDCLVHHLRTGLIKKRILVLVPNEANVESWRDEIAIHQPGLTSAPLPLNRSIPGGVHIVLSNYQRLGRLLTDNVADRKTRKMKWEINAERLERFSDNFDAIVCDESTALMNPRSITTKIALAISWRCEVAYGLTGTPFGRDPQALFSQFLAVDKGETFGANLGLFREAYFSAHRNYWQKTKWAGFTYKLRPDREDDLRRAMRHRSLHYDLEECITLPDAVESTVAVTLSEVAANFYATGRETMQAEATDGLDVRNQFVQLRQIASGFKVVDIDGERFEIPFDDNPKLDALRNLFDEIPQECKIVVFHDFIRSGHEITDLAKEMKIKSAQLSGEGDKTAELRKFLDNPACRLLVTNSKIGALGLNLQIARYVIFYESPVSPIVREQAKARCRRSGSTNTVFYYDIVAKNTVEEKILEWVREGKDLLDAVLRGREVL